MTVEEIKEMMRLLENAGIKAELCDTAIPDSDRPAHCGQATARGDEGSED